jgi:signal peptidase I
MLEYIIVLKNIRDITITLLIAFVMFIGLRVMIEGYTVRYICMTPNINDGDWIIVSKISYHVGDPSRGDVAVLWPPENKVNSEYPFIKRVIGLPGETIEIKDGKVFIDGDILVEDFAHAKPKYTLSEKTIPEDEYFVLGDNRNNSNDSHSWGTVPRDNFIGKAVITYWPLNAFGLIQHYDYSE